MNWKNFPEFSFRNVTYSRKERGKTQAHQIFEYRLNWIHDEASKSKSIQSNPIQSNLISFSHFEAPTKEKNSEIDFYWVLLLFSFVKNAIDWFILCELICLIAFIMKWSHEIVTIFHRSAFRMQQVYVASRISNKSQSVSHFSASVRSFYAIKQTKSARGDKWLCQVREFLLRLHGKTSI